MYCYCCFTCKILLTEPSCDMSLVGLSLCSLMTSGLSKDIQCHVRPTDQTSAQVTQKVGCQLVLKVLIPCLNCSVKSDDLYS